MKSNPRCLTTDPNDQNFDANLKGVEHEVNLDQTIFGIGNSIVFFINLTLANMKIYVKKNQYLLKRVSSTNANKIGSIRSQKSC